jgi:hypothetical protein
VKTFGEQVLSFYKKLGQGPVVPDGVEVLYPHHLDSTWEVMTQFYLKYYNDSHHRTFLIGINPGRLGAGTTGIPFTDPIRLAKVCGIDNDFKPKPELSSKFIYQLIEAYGNASSFYQNFYFTSVSPLGFTRSGKNLNYYDLKELQETWEPFMVNGLKSQLEMGASPRAFSLGQGKNHKYLQYLNKKYQLFEAITPLPHPRWIMQYRLKRLDEFVEDYCSKLALAVT